MEIGKKLMSFRADEDTIRQLEELASKGQVKSISDFIVKCVEYGLKHTLYTWDRGIWYVHGTRVCAVSKSNVDIVTKALDDKVLYETGREVGGEFNLTVKYLAKIDSRNRKNWHRALEEVELLSGWGNFLLKDNLITVVSPSSPPAFLRGILETFLGIKLKQVSEEPLRYEITN